MKSYKPKKSIAFNYKCKIPKPEVSIITPEEYLNIFSKIKKEVKPK